MVGRLLQQFDFQTVLKNYSLVNLISRNSALNKLDETYIEYALISLWSINILEHIKVKASLAKQFHIQPSEIDKMYYWEYEYFIKYINDMVKEENEAQQKQLDQQQVNKYSKLADPKRIEKLSKPNISIPKVRF